MCMCRLSRAAARSLHVIEHALEPASCACLQAASHAYLHPQYHIWLSSNATQLLTIVPGHPLINALCATALFVVISHRLNYLTLSLRGQLLPDDTEACYRGAAGIFAVVAFYRILGGVLQSGGSGFGGILVASTGMGALVLAYIFFSPAIRRFEYGSVMACLCIVATLIQAVRASHQDRGGLQAK